jgi:hypothetical protein
MNDEVSKNHCHLFSSGASRSDRFGLEIKVQASPNGDQKRWPTALLGRPVAPLVTMMELPRLDRSLLDIR